LNIAVIPARSGSKRIPKKNIKNFLGQPIIKYPIDASRASKYIDDIIVSTDCEEIAIKAVDYGAKVPFLRPKEISDDYTPTVPVITHAITALINLGWAIDSVCCIYPCTPLIEAQDIDIVYQKMVNGSHIFAFPVISYSHPIQRAMKMESNGSMSFIYPKYELTRTQELDETFHDSGQFYWGLKDAWLNSKKMHTDGIGVKINKWKAVDIDNEEDWKFAELIKKAYRGKNK